MMKTEVFDVKCRICHAHGTLGPAGLPPGWKLVPHDDYLDEYECGNHETK